MKFPTSLLYIAVIFGWSTSWLPLSWQVTETAIPEVSVFWRFVIAAGLMWGITYQQKRLHAVSWRLQIYMLGLGICIFSTNFTLFYYGSVGVASGLLAVIFASVAFINVLFDAIRLRRRPALAQMSAALIGVSGVAIFFWPEIRTSEAALVSLGFCLTGTCFFCMGNMISAHLQHLKIDVLTANSWGMSWGALFIGIVALVRGGDFFPDPTLKYVGGLVWLAVFSSVLAFSAYLTLIGRIGAAKAGYATVLFPIFALLISSIWEGFVWTAYAVVGIGLVALGNVLMQRSR